MSDKAKEEEALKALANIFREAATFVDENKEEIIVVLSFVNAIKKLGNNNDEKNEL